MVYCSRKWAIKRVWVCYWRIDPNRFKPKDSGLRLMTTDSVGLDITGKKCKSAIFLLNFYFFKIKATFAKFWFRVNIFKFRKFWIFFDFFCKFWFWVKNWLNHPGHLLISFLSELPSAEILTKITNFFAKYKYNYSSIINDTRFKKDDKNVTGALLH